MSYILANPDQYPTYFEVLRSNVRARGEGSIRSSALCGARRV